MSYCRHLTVHEAAIPHNEEPGYPTGASAYLRMSGMYKDNDLTERIQGSGRRRNFMPINLELNGWTYWKGDCQYSFD
jgi:hypothetical protein